MKKNEKSSKIFQDFRGSAVDRNKARHDDARCKKVRLQCGQRQLGRCINGA
jgi:hypothetical protein